VNNLTNILNLVTWSALQLVREILREASRSGKSIEQLLDEAEKQTELNNDLIESLRDRLMGFD
jgi:predicted translin family RNA/ssDNA-binding protein